MSQSYVVADFNSLVNDARAFPVSLAANMQLAGVDAVSVRVLMDHAEGRWPAGLHAGAGTEGPAGHSDVGSESTTNRPGIETYLSAASRHGTPTDERGGADLWDGLKAACTNWWHDVEYRPDGRREPRIVQLHATLYAISVSTGGIEGAMDECTWTADQAWQQGLGVVFGLVGYRLHKKATLQDSRTLVATSGTAVHVYVEAAAELAPSRLYLGGRATEAIGWVPTDFRLSSPLTIGTESLPHPPDADLDMHRALRRFPAQRLADPAPPVYAHSVQSQSKFGLTLPFSTGDGSSLGISMQFNASWTAEHRLTLPVGKEFLLLPTAGVPGAVLASQQSGDYWNTSC